MLHNGGGKNCCEIVRNEVTQVWALKKASGGQDTKVDTRSRYERKEQEEDDEELTSVVPAASEPAPADESSEPGPDTRDSARRRESAANIRDFLRKYGRRRKAAGHIFQKAVESKKAAAEKKSPRGTAGVAFAEPTQGRLTPQERANQLARAGADSMTEVVPFDSDDTEVSGAKQSAGAASARPQAGARAKTGEKNTRRALTSVCLNGLSQPISPRCR